MELIYFISGILTVGIVYGVILLRKVKSSHTELLARHQSQLNISSIRDSESKEQLRDLELLMGNIQNNMERDQYENLGQLNKRIQELDTVVYKNLETANLARQTNDGNFGKTFNEIQQLKTTLKALGQDPNFVSRY
tara:strand:+ start:375 stop:782 length:408 start_codon:yes stop_codon:yes gene_type:complete